MDFGLNEEQRAIVETEGMSVRDGYRVLGESALPAYRAMLDSQDTREGALAFAERRKPVWRGR